MRRAFIFNILSGLLYLAATATAQEKKIEVAKPDTVPTPLADKTNRQDEDLVVAERRAAPRRRGAIFGGFLFYGWLN